MDSTRKICLVPYADMINGAIKNKENTNWNYNAKSKSFEFIANTEIKKGSEVYLISLIVNDCLWA